MFTTEKKNHSEQVFAGRAVERAHEVLATIDTDLKESKLLPPKNKSEAFTMLHASNGVPPELPDGRIQGTSWLRDGVLNGSVLLGVGYLAMLIGAPFASAVIMLSGFAFVVGRIARQLVSKDNKIPAAFLNMTILWGAFQIFGYISLLAAITPFAAVAIPYIACSAALGVLDPFSLAGYLYRRFVQKR